ncbi:polysaccharide deacetylase family protein [Paraferrimonas sp. SM1919]|uniref:polysaccharide deacetylase family protein n=1 Tax=Paraferrimonas sp. SM1919 TaxID=2662263 RepID=UPI0013D1A579|nr:polysaccharide deacetylase family protein [Paraferrimonas sp. SM1919]
MALDNDYLSYPNRHYGMDHQLYEWKMLKDRHSITWPEDKKLALNIVVPLQFFPLNQKDQPFKVPAGMTMPYPDLRHFSLRQYGNRVGIFRVLKALDKFGLRASFAINSKLIEHAPYLMQVIKERGDEVIAHGEQMDALHHSGLDSDTELSMIRGPKAKLEGFFEKEVSGWLSPAKNQGQHTLARLKQAGIGYTLDWVNDDMPYPFTGEAEGLWALPLSTEISDQFILINNGHSEQSLVEQICDADKLLLQEAETQGGRLLTLTIHPWLMGQPHRIKYLEQIFAQISNDSHYCCSCSEVIEICKQHSLL